MATLNITYVVKSERAVETGLFNTGLASCVEGAEALLGDASIVDHLPECNTAKFAGTIEIPVFDNDNQYIRVGATAVAVTADTEEEVAFYEAMAFENDEAKLTVTAAE